MQGEHGASISSQAVPMFPSPTCQIQEKTASNNLQNIAVKKILMLSDMSMQVYSNSILAEYTSSFT